MSTGGKFIWNNNVGSTDFSASGNWLDANFEPTYLVPGVDDSVYFFGTEYVTGNGSVANLTAVGTGGLGFVLGGTLSVGDFVSFQGDGWLDSGSMTVGDEVDIGLASATSVVIEGNSTLSLLGATSYYPSSGIVKIGADGRLAVSGTQAVLNANNLLNVFSSGGLLVDNGATVNVLQLDVADVSSVLVSGGATVNVSLLTVGGGYGATANLALESGSTLNSTNGLYVGAAGDASTLDVYGLSVLTTDGIQEGSGYNAAEGLPNLAVLNVDLATVIDTGTLTNYASFNAGLGAYVDVQGALDNSGAISLSDNFTLLRVDGDFTSGDITVADGAGLLLTSTNATLGGPVITGALAVSGGYVSSINGFQTNGAVIDIPSIGFVDVSQAGTVEVTGADATTFFAGTAIVTGAGSLWQQANGTVIVDGGALSVKAGAALDADQVQINGGTVTVDGTGSAITTGNLEMDGGNVTVSDGGVISAPTMQVDLTVSLLGSLTAGSVFSVDGDISGSGGISAGNIALAGVIDASGGVLAVSGPVSGSGSFQVESGATLSLMGGSVTAGLTFMTDATVDVAANSSFGGVINGWLAGDVIDLAGVAAVNDSYSAGTLALENASGGTLATLVFSNILNIGDFTLGSDPTGGTTISFHG